LVSYVMYSRVVLSVIRNTLGQPSRGFPEKTFHKGGANLTNQEEICKEFARTVGQS